MSTPGDILYTYIDKYIGRVTQVFWWASIFPQQILTLFSSLSPKACWEVNISENYTIVIENLI